MLLGFISLLITFGTVYISKICISAEAAGVMLPCKKKTEEKHDDGPKGGGGGNDRRKLLWYAGDATGRRLLAAATGDDYCSQHVKLSTNLYSC